MRVAAATPVHRQRIISDAPEDQLLAGVVIVVEVRIIVIDRIVKDADRDSGAGIVVPHRGDVEVDAGGAAVLTRILQMPFACEQAVCRHILQLECVGRTLPFGPDRMAGPRSPFLQPISP